MSLRTAPCPSCQNTIVFGERRCRSCGMDFDYGPAGPPEPSQADVMAALMSGYTANPAPAGPAPAPRAPPTPPRDDPAQMEGLDTGRFAGVGDVEVEDIPGFIDSTLFGVMTPATVDTVDVPGLDRTAFAAANVATRKAPEIDSDRAEVGEVATMAAIPGIYGSDMFKANVDVAAGAAGAGDMLDLAPTRAHAKSTAKQKRGNDDDLARVICTNCGSTHSKTRCPSCATTHPDARG